MRIPKLYLLLAAVCLVMASCRKTDDFYTGNASLGFSKSEVYFDTVFTRLPGSPYPRSINKQFMVRNPYDRAVKTNIHVAGGYSSPYRINVDGQGGTFFKDVEIPAKDSIWVFVEATLDANNQTQPIEVKDSIAFETNGNTQFVQLRAFGWDAHYFKDSVLTGNVVFDNSDGKPYVIVNTLFVDENATLTIKEGVHVYSTPQSVYVQPSGTRLNIGALNVLGTLKVEGTEAKPVIFEGDRLENTEPYDYTNVPGQWRGLHFFRSSINNSIEHAVIKNATNGIRVDSLADNNAIKLKLRKTLIKNCSSIGLLGITASIDAENTVISNCASNTVYGYLGGLYTFRHCTFYNSSAAGRRDPHFIIGNILRDDNGNKIQVYTPIDFSIQNSIIGGPNEQEIGFDIDASTPPPTGLTNGCMISYKKTPIIGTNNTPIPRTSNPLKFKDPSKSDLSLTAGSPAIDACSSIGVIDDITDKLRDAKPDCGAYEF